MFTCARLTSRLERQDVVIVIDVSGSMGQHGRLDLAKEAAVTVVNTL